MVETLGDYKILDRIGAGGMGEVYRARDTRRGRTVAIKVIDAGVAGDPERREQFLRDARAAAALSHPNIAALYEIGEEQDQLFLVFEFVPGETLTTAIGGRPLNARRAIDLAIQLADALADAHVEGIVHRDIKPGNIIVTPKGNAKILDFGLATWTAGGQEREHAGQADTLMPAGAGATLPTLGTVAYMSPEQVLHEQVDYRTDTFSLGMVLFEMLTGKLPFKGTTPSAVALQIVQAPAPVPSSVNRSLPREADTIVAKALAKSLDQRYESAATLAAELRSLAAILDVRSDSSEAAASVPMSAASPGRSLSGWITLLIVVAALAAAAWFERAAIQRVWRRTLGPAPAPVMVVIPLELAAPDVSQTFFADGLTEDLITRLGQTPGLKIVGRSAMRNDRGRSPRDLARELNATVVLTGSFRSAADAVNVSLELIDPSDSTTIWSSQYARDLNDVFAVQAQVAEDVALALRLKLQPTASSARTAARLVDAGAYTSYLHGRQAAADRQVSEAIRQFRSAIAADGGLAEAFAGLARALQVEMQVDPQLDEPTHRDAVKEAASRAHEIDPDLPEANLAKGVAADALPQALASMRRAVELDPSYSDAYRTIGDQIQDIDPDRAIAFYRKSLALDPRLDINHASIAAANLALDRADAALQELDALHAGSTADGWGQGLRVVTDVENHRFEQALAMMRRLPSVKTIPPFWLTYVVALRMAGFAPDATQEASQLVRRFPGLCAARAVLAGLRRERGDMVAARRLADPLLRAAREDAAQPAAVRCAVVAAAAMNDAAQTAALLDRIASHESWLRYWSLPIAWDLSGVNLRGRSYPWTNVVNRSLMPAARQHIADAYDRQREAARTALAGLP